jgi:hypothetical protein
LKDTAHDRWAETVLLEFFNEGQREIVGLDPASNIVTKPVLLAAGVTQATPSDCQELIDISLNLGRAWVASTVYYPYQFVYESDTRYRCLEGHTSSANFGDDSAYWEEVTYSSGQKIDMISEANVDQILGNAWSMQSEIEDTDYEPIVQAWVQKEGPDAYQNFFVYPSQPVTGRMYVEMVYSQIPADVLITANITLRDKYAAQILDYILFRAYSVDMDNENNANVAVQYWNKFLGSPMVVLKRRS